MTQLIELLELNNDFRVVENIVPAGTNKDAFKSEVCSSYPTLLFVPK